MATARERLLQALISIVCQPYSEPSATALKRLLNSYRVQVKRGEPIEKVETARGTLADSLVGKWRAGEALSKKELIKLIAPFRLQVKAGLGQGRLASTNEAKAASQAQLTNAAGLTRSQIRENILHHENAYFKKDPSEKQGGPRNIPVAGGHRPKLRSRGLCPKCRSLGIVAATEYGGEDYLSCVYCGYQDHKNGPSDKLDLPLAAQFLGDAFEEPDPDEK